jgi:hypothetical protein
MGDMDRVGLPMDRDTMNKYVFAALDLYRKKPNSD